jgi:DNA-binding Lrp family transcriptional regulator
MLCNFSKSQVEFIIYLYNTGKTQVEIAKQLNCSQVTISNILKKEKIITRIGKNTIYKDVNLDFFKNINNELNAYFLGFLYADGCVQIKNNCYTVSIKIHKKDQVIVDKFKEIMSPSSPIKFIDDKYCYYRIHQKEVCDQLISHGCIPNKSLILKFPTTVPDNLLHHFVRGYSDGDGSIYKNNTNIIWKIISTNNFCNTLSNILKEKLNINSSMYLSKPSTNSITTTLVVGGNLQIKKLLDWLYKDATMYLDRKYKKGQLK